VSRRRTPPPAAPRPPGDSRWRERPEAGHALGLRLVELVARLFGRRAVHWFVAPIATYFLATRGVERRASRAFLSRALGRPARLGDSLRHFYTFARVAVDRVFLLAPHGRRIPMRVTGQQPMEATLARGQGCILLSAHFGSFEAARQAGLANPALRLRVLLDRAVNRRLLERLERIDPVFAADIIDVAGPPHTLALRIGGYLRAGDWIGWLGDRYRGDERTLELEFLGAPARFPASPFLIAHLLGVPVFLVLAAFGGDGYDVVVEQLVDDAALATSDRDAFVRERATLFASRLAHHVRRSPYNWFNFYDFWADN
jgi:predicted LPLAT superfamily acyltransferase